MGSVGRGVYISLTCDVGAECNAHYISTGQFLSVTHLISPASTASSPAPHPLKGGREGEECSELCQ